MSTWAPGRRSFSGSMAAQGRWSCAGPSSNGRCCSTRVTRRPFPCGSASRCPCPTRTSVACTPRPRRRARKDTTSHQPLGWRFLSPSDRSSSCSARSGVNRAPRRSILKCDARSGPPRVLAPLPVPKVLESWGIVSEKCDWNCNSRQEGHSKGTFDFRRENLLALPTFWGPHRARLAETRTNWSRGVLTCDVLKRRLLS